VKWTKSELEKSQKQEGGGKRGKTCNRYDGGAGKSARARSRFVLVLDWLKKMVVLS